MSEINELADVLSVALRTYDLDGIEAVLDPKVTWGNCSSPADVVAHVGALKAAGVVPRAIAYVVEDERIVMSIEASSGDESFTSHQAVFVEQGRVVEIVQGETKAEAMSAQRSAAFAAGETPTPFESVAPVVPVSDMAAAIAHYRGLGFAIESYDGGDFYAFAKRGAVDLHLCRVADLDPKTTTTSIYLYVGDARALFAEWRDAGLDGRFGTPLEADYGLTEGFHIDPWGNLLRYGSPNE